MLEEAQGADVQGRSIIVDYVGDKSQKGAKVPGKVFRHLIMLHWYFKLILFATTEMNRILVQCLQNSGQLRESFKNPGSNMGRCDC